MSDFVKTGEFKRGTEPPKFDFPPKRVDLAFAMDCTGSMANYIQNARDVSEDKD